MFRFRKKPKKNNKYATLSVTKETKERLMIYRSATGSYDKAINELIDLFEGK